MLAQTRRVGTPFLWYNISMEREKIIIQRLRAVGNSDNAKAIYEYYKSQGELCKLYQMMGGFGDYTQIENANLLNSGNKSDNCSKCT